MGNIITISQPKPMPIKNYIKKGEYPNSKYFSNNFLREWIAEKRIDVNYHKWLPLGVNYSTLYKTTNEGIICEVYEVRSYFSKTQLTLQNHVSNVQILNENCYILLSEKQQILLNLEKKPIILPRPIKIVQPPNIEIYDPNDVARTTIKDTFPRKYTNVGPDGKVTYVSEYELYNQSDELPYQIGQLDNNSKEIK